MPKQLVNGVRVYYELHGKGQPLALVHGSWGDATDVLLPSPEQALERVAETGGLFASVLTVAQQLPGRSKVGAGRCG